MVEIPREFKEAFVAFSIANPLLTLIIVVIGLAILFLAGGVALTTAISLLMSPLVWGIALIITGIFRVTEKTVFPFAILMGFLVWLNWLIPQIQAIQAVVQWWSGIPIIGGLIGMLIGTGITTVSLMGWLFNLGVAIGVSFILIWMLSFIKQQLVIAIR
jgi:hypothetical protein